MAKLIGNDSAQIVRRIPAISMLMMLRCRFSFQWANRSRNFINNWDADLEMPGEPSIKGFMQVSYIF